MARRYRRCLSISSYRHMYLDRSIAGSTTLDVFFKDRICHEDADVNHISRVWSSQQTP